MNGQIDSATGAISGATLSMPPVTQPPTLGETPTFTFTEVHPGTATGSYNSTTGAVTLHDQLSLSFHIDPLDDTCISSPINVALSGTYDSTTQDVTLATTSSFTIPQFLSSPNCLSAVADGVNASPGGVAGSVGNSMSLALHGQFAPGLPTTTTLSVSPASPQLAGTAVTLSATVTDPSGAGTPDGNVNFSNNGAVIGSGALSPSGTTGTATASYIASSLPGGTNQLSVAYTGSTTYAASTAASQSYAIEPVPTVSANIPSQMTVGTATQFTLTIANPTSGQSFPNVYVAILENGQIDKSAANRPTLSYQDGGGNWCPLTSTRGEWFLSGIGDTPCGTPPQSMALAAGTTISIPMELTYPGLPGTDLLDVGLFTGTCTAPTTCKAVAPFNKIFTSGGGNTPGFGASYTVLPTSGLGTAPTTITDAEPSRPATTTVRQGFGVGLVAKVNTANTNYPLVFPTGTVQFFVNGQAAASEQLITDFNSGCAAANGLCAVTNNATPPTYNTADLAPGSYTVVMLYSGDTFFAQSSLTETFTVVAPPPAGALYNCTLSGIGTGTLSGYVTVTGYGVPATAVAGTTVQANSVSVTLDADPLFDGYGGVSFNSGGTGQSGTTIGFSSGGASATPGSIAFAGGGTSTDYVGTWSGLSTSVTITGNPGDAVQLGITSIGFTYGIGGGGTLSCVPAGQPASLGSVTVSGNTLSASPSGSAMGGAPVTLTDTVYPTPTGTTAGTWGQVDFYDGATDLATVPVDATGDAGNGTASFTTATLPLGDHQLTAIWNGNGNVAPNTSNTVDYTVGTATTATLASSANPANAAHSVTYTATVTPPDGSTTMPTGDVSFTQDGNPISSCQNVALSMDSPPTATCTVNYGAGQSHAIVATYSGDATYIGSVSDTLTQTTLPGTNTSILSTKDPSPPGNVTFWSGVSPSSSKGATPTGTVAFSIDGSTYKACASQPLGSGGGASCTVSFKVGTSHKVFATYPGSASYSGSKSNTITQTVAGAKGSTGPKTTGGSATLGSGKALTSGQSIATGSYKLIMQGDGNLVEYQGSKALWASGTAGDPGAGVTMQKDGNLVIYSQGKAIWASKTAGHAGSHLTLQASDGNVVIYTPAGHPVWATGT